MMSNLTLRQQTLVDISKKSNLTIDVGCDHGYVGFGLLESKKTKFLIASDISKKCAQKTEKLLKEKNLEKFAFVRVGDGIVAKPNEKIDQVVVAGMGGKEIVHILTNFKPKTDVHFVLQPMKELVFLRKFLSENGFKILKDFVLKDKQKFYHMITAKIGNQTLSKTKQRWGAKPHLNNVDFFEWINQKEQKIKNILSNLPQNSTKEKDFVRCLKEIEKLKSKRSKLC